MIVDLDRPSIDGRRFGELMRSRRRAMNITMEDMAARIGATKTQIWRWETKSLRGPRPPVRRAIVRALGLDRPLPGTTLDETAALETQGPCEAFQCQHRERCRDRFLACEQFLDWTAGRPCHWDGNPRPRRAIYLRVFSGTEVDE